MTKHRYIVRTGRPTSRRWVVRFQGDIKPAIAHTFADAQYGGKEQALQAAMVWRDVVAPILGKPLDGCFSSSGFVGVFLQVTFHPNGIDERHIYRAQWRETNERGVRGYRKRDFRFNEDDPESEAHALNRAMTLRDDMVIINHKLKY